LRSKIAEERYAKLSLKYEIEQTDVEKQLDAINSEIEQHKDKSASVADFVKLIRKHSEIKKSTCFFFDFARETQVL
jgi:hypothetical protein